MSVRVRGGSQIKGDTCLLFLSSVSRRAGCALTGHFGIHGMDEGRPGCERVSLELLVARWDTYNLGERRREGLLVYL